LQRFSAAKNAGAWGLIPSEGLNPSLILPSLELGSGKLGTPCARMQLAKRNISAKFSAFWAAVGAWSRPPAGTSATQSRSAPRACGDPGPGTPGLASQTNPPVLATWTWTPCLFKHAA
jgi:hypothetical protein